MSHRNARLTIHGRRLIITRVDAGWTQAQTAAAMGVSRSCVQRWIHRYRTEGEAGLLDRSSRPHRTPTRTVPATEKAVIRMRRRQRVGRDEIATRLGVSPRTVSRILVRHNMPVLGRLDPISGAVIRASRVTPHRYERDRPGELVHMDVKKLGRIPDGGGWRADGGTRANHRRSGVRVPGGYDYVHSLIDDHSRLAYSEVLSDEKGVTCAGFLERAIEYFAARGVDRIERLITDNAFAYRHSLGEVCARHAIRQKFIRPHCPWQNGKAERFNRTLQTEWAYRRAYRSNNERADALAEWLEFYNTERRHTALDGQSPTSRLLPT